MLIQMRPKPKVIYEPVFISRESLLLTHSTQVEETDRAEWSLVNWTTQEESSHNIAQASLILRTWQRFVFAFVFCFVPVEAPLFWSTASM